MCSRCYDLACTNAEKRYNIMSAQNKKNWKCHECVIKKPKPYNTETPVKTGPVDDPSSSNVTLRNKALLKSQLSPEPQVSSRPEQTGEAADMSSELVMEIRLLREEIKASRMETQEFRTSLSRLTADLAMSNKRIDELSGDLAMSNKRVDELTARLDAVEHAQRQNTNIKNNNLEETVACLKMDLNDRDQEILCNDVEIVGIPEENNERTLHLAHIVSKKLGVQLEEHDIVNAERAGVAHRSETQDGRAPRPRPIVVRLARHSLRDQLLAAARTRRGVTTADMGLSSSAKTFYVNERLTRHNRQLFYKARAEALRCLWKFVWTRDGCIYARKEEGAPRRRLRIEADITKFFGY
ncbi:uncharacterized protein LOC134805837 [Cydia splendana]|uniref:uncharacterized protein LOC134805837 n=1 Tax=Cydia splendana TaxID=1100963 RepID=UPI00300DB081